MTFRRTVRLLVVLAVVGAVLPVVAASPVAAACGALEPPCAEIDESTGTPREVFLDGFGTAHSTTASFTFAVPGGGNVEYECRVERDGAVVSDYTTCTSPHSFATAVSGGYVFLVRATAVPPALCIPLLCDPNPPAGPADSFRWDVAAPAVTGGKVHTRLGNVPRRWHTDNWFSVDLLGNAARYECRLDRKVRPCDRQTAEDDDLFNVFGLRPGDHRITVTGIGADGSRDPKPATADFTVPQNATLLTGARGWTRVRGVQRGPMVDQYLLATKRGASITKGFKGVRKIALVVTRAPGAGRVKVFLGNKKVKTIDLRAPSVRYRQVVVVKKFPRKTKGTLRIVTTSKKRVAIEGLAFSSR